MTLQYSVAVRNARLDVTESTIGASPVVRIRERGRNGRSRRGPVLLLPLLVVQRSRQQLAVSAVGVPPHVMDDRPAPPEHESGVPSEHVEIVKHCGQRSSQFGTPSRHDAGQAHGSMFASGGGASDGAETGEHPRTNRAASVMRIAEA